MDREKLLASWLEEERAASIHGWDFSHINGRYDEEGDLPWDYTAVVKTHLAPDMRLLDTDTGGAELLLSLRHPYPLTAATENYPPNAALCRERLLPLGIDFKQADTAGVLPYPDAEFDMVINRHGSYNPQEIYRVLKPGGVFVTEQVGAENDRELVTLLLGALPLPFPLQYQAIAQAAFERAGFEILCAEEACRPIKFYDVGALVWFAHIIEWEFPGFSVKKCLPQLYRAQEMLESGSTVAGTTHRFLLVAKKPPEIC